MGWVCQAGHFTPVNLNVDLEMQRPGGKQPPYGAVCHCGVATWPMIVCTEGEFRQRFVELAHAAGIH